MSRNVIAPAGTALALLCVALLPACFVDSGECVAQGVRVTPCTIPMKIGQTRTFTAAVTADPDEDVDWLISPAVDTGFDAFVDGNELELVGTLGLGGVYKLRAASATDPERFGEAIISMTTHSYGYPPPPVQVNGTDFPEDYEGEVAVGGDLYYVAYADPLILARSSVVPANFFVQQFALNGDAELAAVEGQFALFGARDPLGVPPNIAADCQGNGYWLDRPDNTSPIEIRRLSTAGTLSSFPLPNFDDVGAMAVACDGKLYFYGLAAGANFGELYQISSFGAAPVLFAIPEAPFAGSTFDSIATDPENRLILGDQNPDGNPAIIRVIPDPVLPIGDVDETFAVDLALPGVSAVAVDGSSVVYGAAQNAILGINSLGTLIYVVNTYLYNCPAGCATADCGSLVQFQDIRSLGAADDGRLRVIDNVTLGAVPLECQVTLRLILIDP